MRCLVPLALLALAAACSKPEKEQPTVHEVMLNTVDKHADELWDVTNSAIGDEGGLDGSKMDDAKWNEVIRLAAEVQAGAEQLAALDPLKATRPGVKIADEDLPYGDSAASVQANLDKNPELFRQFAGTLAGHMRDLGEGAKKHDAATVGPLVDQLDQVCEGCHLDFWYPSQKGIVEAFQKGSLKPAGK